MAIVRSVQLCVLFARTAAQHTENMFVFRPPRGGAGGGRGLACRRVEGAARLLEDEAGLLQGREACLLRHVLKAHTVLQADLRAVHLCARAQARRSSRKSDTAQVGISEFSNFKTWHEIAQVCGMTACMKSELLTRSAFSNPSETARIIFEPVFVVVAFLG